MVNFLFLTLAVLLHGTPARLLKASEEAASVLHGIVLQFPLYAGIYGIFKATGLTERIGQLFVSLSTAEDLPRHRLPLQRRGELLRALGRLQVGH